MNASIARHQLPRLACALMLAAATAGVGSSGISAQSKTPPAQRLDADYTAKIKAATADPRILTELVDHMPASDKVPSPLKFLGYIPGEPGHMTYYKDIARYLEALDKASDRVTMFKIGVSDEGRDMFGVAVADEATIKQLDKYPADHRAADRPAQADRRAGEAPRGDGEADLLRLRQHPLAGDRQSRDADGAGVPAGDRGDAVHPDDSQQHHLRVHAGERGGRPREAGRQLRRAAEGSAIPLDGVLGQVRPARQQPRRHRRGPAPHAGDAEDVPRLASDGLARPARVGDAALHVNRHRSIQQRRRSDSGERVVPVLRHRVHRDEDRALLHVHVVARPPHHVRRRRVRPVPLAALLHGQRTVGGAAEARSSRTTTSRTSTRSSAGRAAEREFEAGGHRFAPGAFIVTDDLNSAGTRAALESSIRELGLSAWAVDAAPNVPMHDLDVPRIGYVHTWTSTQDEGWVRLAFDNFKVPYTYFGAPKLREGSLRAKYDVIVFPHAGQGGAALVTSGVQGAEPRPYKKTDVTPNVGTVDSTDDMRGSIGIEGLMELYKFVQQGGLLITEGATSTVFPAYNLTPGVSVETPDNLYVRGAVLKAVLGDKTSPVLYGYDQNTLAVYFNQAPVMRVGAAAGFGGRGGGANVPPVGNLQPNAVQPNLTTLDGPPAPPAAGAGGRGGRGGFGGGVPGVADPDPPRVLLSFPANPNDLLLSGLLIGGDALAGRAVTIDAPIGKGHVVMFANRPYWRWQTQGNFFLGFNAILNWNDLDAGRTMPRPSTTDPAGQQR